jgi:hypothetical protein
MGACQCKFRVEEIALSDEYIKIIGEPAFIAETCEL